MGRGFSPLDDELGLLPGSLTPSLVEDLVRLGTWMPFGQAAKQVGHFRKVDVAEATVRRTTEKSGAAYVEAQTAQVEELERAMPSSPDGPQLQQLSVDGAMVPLLHKQWGEVKTLVIGTLGSPPVWEGGQWEVHAQDLSYFSRRAKHENFSRQALVELHRRGTERAGAVCAVVDGAEWEQKFIDLHRPDAVRILDFGHAAEYVVKAGQAVSGGGTEATSEWVGVQLRQLKHGDSYQVLRELGRLRRVLAEQGDAAEALKTVNSSLEYLGKRREQIKYADFQAMGYPIGSGIVESANKLVVEARLKGSGMHWAEEHVDPMVALRNIVYSDRWEEAWPQIVQRRREQAKERGARRRAERTSAKPSEAEVAPVLDAKSAPMTPKGVKPGKGTPTLTLVENHPSKGAKRPAPDHPWRRMSVGRVRLSPTPAMASAEI